ncbi:MAG: Pycsar system effector family protein [Ilumatobacteraceae bacterium]
MSEESYILRLLDECREEIRQSDSKASIIFAAVATTTALLTDLLLDKARALRTNGGFVTALGLVAVAMLVVAMVMLGLAVIPRVGHPEPGKARYFGEQAQFETPESLLMAVTADAAGASARHAQQLLIMARIARRKYVHLRRAMLSVAAAGSVMIIAVFVSAVT